NQLVEDGRRVELDAVLVDVDAGRLRRVVLLGHVDPVIADRAGEDLAPVEGVAEDLTLRGRGRPGFRTGGSQVGQGEQGQEPGTGKEWEPGSLHGRVLSLRPR